MLVKQLEKEEFEFDTVVIEKNEEGNKWAVKHEDKVVCDIFNTEKEAELWATKISKEVGSIQHSKIIWEDIKEKELYTELSKRGRELNLYLNSYSIARSILFAIDLPLFTAPIHKTYSSDILLSDIYMLSKRYKSDKITDGYELSILSDKDFSSFSDEFGYRAELFEISIINKVEKGCSDKVFEDIKKDLLKEEEDTFIFFIKEVAKRNDRYIICNNLQEAAEKISKIDYKEAWVPEKFLKNNIVKGVSKQRELVSSNLQGFILSQHDVSVGNGILDIRQAPTILYSSKDSDLVSFEEIAMTVYGKSLIYVEINENS